MKNSECIQQLHRVYEHPEFNRLFSHELGKAIMKLQMGEQSNLSEVIEMFLEEMETRILPFLNSSGMVELEKLVQESEKIHHELKKHEKDVVHLASEAKKFQKQADQLSEKALALQKKSEALLKA